MSDYFKLDFPDLNKIIADVGGMDAEIKKELAIGIYKEAEEVMTTAKTIVPVGLPPADKHPGALRASGHVQPPQWDGDKVKVELGFGGVAVDYAAVQHENLEFHHRGGQTAKYLEGPLLGAINNGMDDRLAERVAAAAKRKIQ